MKKFKRINELFTLNVADSRDTQDYEVGTVAFVTSSEINNGIVRYVKPQLGDKLFKGPCIIISGLGLATVHTGTVLPKGNGGDSCTVLYAKDKLSLAGHIGVAAAFNVLHNWRFSFGRKCGKTRIEGLEIPWPLPPIKTAWEDQNDTAIKLLKTLENNLDRTLPAEQPAIWKGI
jgi:hypothetical protein